MDLLKTLAFRLIPPRRPAVVVIAIPRSGSSWVGEILGAAPDALYLREPLTQSIQAQGEQRSVFDVDPAAPPEAYAEAAERAFRGMPTFPPDIVIFPEQWRLRRRPGRRVVIKEVNPLACRWLIERYRPRVVLLLRHPGALLASGQRLHWTPRGPGAAGMFGHEVGETLRSTLDVLDAYAEHLVVQYEDVCRDAAGSFRRLYAFAGLTWTSDVERAVVAHSRSGSRDETYGTFRNSEDMLTAWRGALGPEELQRLRESYRSFRLPWYAQDEEWR